MGGRRVPADDDEERRRRKKRHPSSSSDDSESDSSASESESESDSSASSSESSDSDSDTDSDERHKKKKKKHRRKASRSRSKRKKKKTKAKKHKRKHKPSAKALPVDVSERVKVGKVKDVASERRIGETSPPERVASVDEPGHSRKKIVERYHGEEVSHEKRAKPNFSGDEYKIPVREEHYRSKRSEERFDAQRSQRKHRPKEQSRYDNLRNEDGEQRPHPRPPNREIERSVGSNENERDKNVYKREIKERGEYAYRKFYSDNENFDKNDRNRSKWEDKNHQRKGNGDYDRTTKEFNPRHGESSSYKNDHPPYKRQHYNKNDKYEKPVEPPEDESLNHRRGPPSYKRNNYDDREDDHNKREQSYNRQGPPQRPDDYQRKNRDYNNERNRSYPDRDEDGPPPKRRFEEKYSNNPDEPPKRYPPGNSNRNVTQQRSSDNERFESSDKNRPSTSYTRKDRSPRKRGWDNGKEATYEWGKKDKSNPKAAPEKVDKEKPNFGLSGKLTEDTNTVNGVVLKYSEPLEARKPKRRWRFYPFRGETALPILYIHRQSYFLLGRDRMVADIPLDHPSISKQHAVLQYRLVPFTREDGSQGKRVRPYIIDLGSSNGTFVNNKPIEPSKYVELMERDVIKFGFSQREYVLLHENSKEEMDDDDDVKPTIKTENSPLDKKIKSEPED